MIWVAITLAFLTFAYLIADKVRDWPGIGLNVLFVLSSIMMSLTVSRHAWDFLTPLSLVYKIFVPATRWLYNLF